MKKRTIVWYTDDLEVPAGERDFEKVLKRVTQRRIHNLWIKYGFYAFTSVILITISMLIFQGIERNSEEPGINSERVLDSLMSSKIDDSIRLGIESPEEEITQSAILRESISSEPEVAILQEMDTPVARQSDLLADYEEATPIVGFDSLYIYLNDATEGALLGIEMEDDMLEIHFYIEETGLASKVKIPTLENDSLAELITDIILKMPLWEPAKVNDKPVRTKFKLPLRIHSNQVVEPRDSLHLDSADG